jgi:gas vesicle protein
MIYKYPEYERPPNNVALGVWGGMLMGVVVGAAAMMLLVPRSGKDTRRQIQKKGIELRDRTTGMVEDTLVQVRSNPTKVEMSVKNYEQLEHVSDAP